MKVLDLFSGIGGFSLGLERAGMETVAFCEIEEFPRKVLKKHWPDVPIFEDVRDLTGNMVGSVDVICGGFPCQDISTAGKGAGINGSRSGLWKEYHRLIGEIRPSWAIIENVSALRSKGLITVLQNLSEIGYDAEWHCIPASYIGALHRRDRIWIVAYPSRCWRGREDGNISGANESPPEPETQHEDKAGGFVDASPDTEVLAHAKSRNIWHVRKDFRETRAEVYTPSNASGSCRGDDKPKDGEPLAHPNHKGLESWFIGTAIKTEVMRIKRPGCTGGFKPGLGRGFNGVPSWLDGSWEAGVPRVTTTKTDRAARLKSLGNSIVPQMAEIIGRSIMSIKDVCHE